MEPDFWLQRWRNAQTGFHQSSVDEDLARHWAALTLPAGARVFVPLCGKSLDLLWLCAQGCTVTGVELSAIAVEAFCAQNGIAARRRVLPEFDRYESPSLHLLRGNFFAVRPPLLGPVAAVYDRASLVSWPCAARPRYVDHLLGLTIAGTQTLLVTLEYPQHQMPGPPFSVDGAEIERLYSPHHAIERLDRRDILAREPRMRSRGVSSLFSVCYRLTRLDPLHG